MKNIYLLSLFISFSPFPCCSLNTLNNYSSQTNYQNTDNLYMSTVSLSNMGNFSNVPVSSIKRLNTPFHALLGFNMLPISNTSNPSTCTLNNPPSRELNTIYSLIPGGINLSVSTWSPCNQYTFPTSNANIYLISRDQPNLYYNNTQALLGASLISSHNSPIDVSNSNNAAINIQNMPLRENVLTNKDKIDDLKNKPSLPINHLTHIPFSQHVESLNTQNHQPHVTPTIAQTSKTRQPSSTSRPAGNQKGKRFECKECPRSYSQKGDLKDHRISHTHPDKVKCKICNKKCTSLRNLKTHLRVHSEQRPFKCFCDKTFKLSGNYTRHLRLHSGEKPFICKDKKCQKRFAAKSTLKTHIKNVHKKERRWACFCGKRFKRKAHLQGHKKNHLPKEKKYGCDSCTGKFETQHKLKRHQRIHTGEATHICPSCNTSFVSKSSLNAHKRKRHKTLYKY